ncbi:MAG: hypothetical protein Q4G16_04400, partial [Cruoricaptor ignavus]|nr:hypothetical protein [Cruoricaptor ignavus]
IQNTKYLAYLLIFIANLCAIFWCEFGYSLAFYLSSIVAFILIYHSENENKDSYFSVFVESCSLLPFLFLMVLRQKL